MKTRIIQIALAVLIGVIALYFFITGQDDWGKVWNAIQQTQWGYVLLAVLLQFLSMYIRALRWRSFLGAPKVSTTKLFLISNIGFMGNGVFPARMGELIRPFLVGRYTPHTFSAGLATIVVERIFDLLGILLILAYVLAVFPFPAAPAVIADEALINLGDVEIAGDPRTWIQGLAMAGIAIFAAMFAVVGVIAYAPEWSLRIVRWLCAPLPVGLSLKIEKFVIAFEQGATTFRRPRSFIYCLFLTFVLWIVIALSELVVFWAFGITTVGFHGALFFMVGLCFAVMFPQLPGYIGVYQLAAVLILVQTFHVDLELSYAVALVMWASQVPPIIVGGFVCLLIMGVSFTEISRAHKQLGDKKQ